MLFRGCWGDCVVGFVGCCGFGWWCCCVVGLGLVYSVGVWLGCFFVCVVGFYIFLVYCWVCWCLVFVVVCGFI